jgi:hypothetical protein
MGASVEDTATARDDAGAHDVRRHAGSGHRNGAEHVEAARRTAVDCKEIPLTTQRTASAERFRTHRVIEVHVLGVRARLALTSRPSSQRTVRRLRPNVGHDRKGRISR